MRHVRAPLRLARERLRRLRGEVLAAVLPAVSAAPRTTAVRCVCVELFPDLRDRDPVHFLCRSQGGANLLILWPRLEQG